MRALAKSCIAFVLVLGLPTGAGAVVVSPPSTDSGTGTKLGESFYVGSWNGASAVAVGDRWVLTARHVGGSVGDSLVMNGTKYSADRVVFNRSEDLMLIRLTEQLPGWHTLVDRGVSVGDRVLLAGAGYRSSDQLQDGVTWSQTTGPAIGANRIDQVGDRLSVTFDPPGAELAEPDEAIFALGDSGSGLFVNAGGSWRLAGLAVTISSTFGVSRYGDYASAVNLDGWQWWVESLVAPGVPVASSVPPPPQGAWFPPRVPAPAAGFALFGLALLSRRRSAA
ncbi:MAG: trypsin-like serine protease [Phycisphaeraceae bacterium]|nr:trypsin-like serine protease [Phycisphaeraceae bacterium]